MHKPKLHKEIVLKLKRKTENKKGSKNEYLKVKSS